jgi:hypothetical protein
MKKKFTDIQALIINENSECVFMQFRQFEMMEFMNDLDEMKWFCMCEYTDKKSMDMLNKNKDKIYWDVLSLNKNAIELLKENQENIDWYEFSKNPNIFTYDYKIMKKNMKNSGIAEELMSVIFHPKNMNKWKDWGFTEHQEIINLINEN